MAFRTEIKWNRYGKRIALWEFEYRTQPSWRKICYELCKCDCWTIRFVKRASLINWESLSCECYRNSVWYREKLSSSLKWANKKHWLAWTKFYSKYHDIVNRCNNKRCKAYRNYWLRWIKCLWNNFEEFADDMYDSYVDHCIRFWERWTTIDRIDVNWNYCKENCRWATTWEQNTNKRNNIYIIYNWEQRNLMYLCRYKWLKYATIRKRINDGWDVSRAIDTYL